MISTQITTKLFAALVLGQCEHVPTTVDIPADSTVASATPSVPHAGMVVRDEFFSSHYKVFGPSGEADIAALEAGMSMKMAETGIVLTTQLFRLHSTRRMGASLFHGEKEQTLTKRGFERLAPNPLGLPQMYP